MRTGARAQPSDEAEGISPCNASDRHRLALAVQYSPWEAAHLASLACFQLHAAVCLMARLPPQAAGFFHARAKWVGCLGSVWTFPNRSGSRSPSHSKKVRPQPGDVAPYIWASSLIP